VKSVAGTKTRVAVSVFLQIILCTEAVHFNIGKSIVIYFVGAFFPAMYLYAIYKLLNSNNSQK
jgi:hypothetical protein